MWPFLGLTRACAGLGRRLGPCPGRAPIAILPTPPRSCDRYQILNRVSLMAVVESSYYAHSAARPPDRPTLVGQAEADVCVIGGGIGGCSHALHLAERGYRVVLLESQRIGYGASGRSGGQAIAGYACGQGKLERQVGFENARRMW